MKGFEGNKANSRIYKRCHYLMPFLLAIKKIKLCTVGLSHVLKQILPMGIIINTPGIPSNQLFHPIITIGFENL